MKYRCIILIYVFITAGCMHQEPAIKPIALHPENPHYFIYENKPTVLIGSGEHYGAVLNLDFDYKKYLNTLSEDSLNVTRTFTGAYVEPVGAFNIEQNTLAPAPNRFICPWARSETPGYANGGNKFDLGKWDNQYFHRLRDFVHEALKNGVIVELTFFCPFYSEAQWELSPMNPRNNVNGSNVTNREHVYTLDKSGKLLSAQEAMVRKIVSELKEYPNVIYEICNEPYFGGVTNEWQRHIAEVVRDKEKTFEYQHLISQNIANGSVRINEPLNAVSVFNFHYATPPHAVSANYNLKRVIGDNETGFNGTADSTYRREGWSFLLAGGALYNNLDYSFTVGHENGTFSYPETQPGGGSVSLRKQLSTLRSFINSFDLSRLKPDSTSILNRATLGEVRMLADSGHQYAIYIPRNRPVEVELEIPNATWAVTFVNPSTGISHEQSPVTSKGGVLRITTPPYPEDVGIKVKLVGL